MLCSITCSPDASIKRGLLILDHCIMYHAVSIIIVPCMSAHFTIIIVTSVKETTTVFEPGMWTGNRKP